MEMGMADGGDPDHFGNISWYCKCDTAVMDSAPRSCRGSPFLPQPPVRCRHLPGRQVHSSPSPRSAGQAWLCWAGDRAEGRKEEQTAPPHTPAAWVPTEMTKMSANQGQRFKSRQRGTGKGGVWIADRGGTSQVYKRLPPPPNFESEPHPPWGSHVCLFIAQF